MTQGVPTPGLLWLVVVVLGVGTFALRISGIQLHAWLDEFPPRAERVLVFVPPAILAAIVFPALFPVEGSLVGVFTDPRLLAGGLAALVAWRTGSMLATIGVGMAVLWTVGFVLG